MSIRSKFILILVFSLAAMAAGISFFAHFQSTREADAAFIRQAADQLDRVDDIIHIYFKSVEKAATNLASLPEARDMALARTAMTENEQMPAGPEAALLQRLASLPALVPGVEAAFCGYKNGSFHSSSAAVQPEGYDARAQSWYSDTAWGPADISVTSVAISAESKSPVATVASKIKDNDGQTLGVAAIIMNIGPLTDTLRDVRFGRGGYVVLFDAEGRVLFDPKAQENLLRPAAETDSALLSLARLPAGRHEFSRDNTDFLALSRILPDTRWKAAILTDNAEQTAPFLQAFQTALLVTLLSCLALAIVGILAAFCAARPLYALIRQSRALADGNDEALGGIAGRGPDIAALQHNIGQLTGRVMLLAQAEKEHASAMKNYARETLAIGRSQADATAKAAYRAASHAAAQALAPVAAAVDKEAAVFAEQAGKLHDLTRAQALAAANIRTAAVNLLDDIATMARQATETEKNVETAFERVRKSDNLMRDTTRALKGMEEAATVLVPGLEAFKAETGEMAAMTAAVRGLAEAINVLGLKLSIEASSAGENGKNFTPVAEEMRTLAERAMAVAGSMDAASAVLEQTRAAHALAVNKNVTAVRRATANAAKTGDELARATATAGTTVEQIRVLATTIEGVAQADILDPASAESTLRATRDTDDALKALDTAAGSFAAFATRLAVLTNGFAAAPSEEIVLKD